MGHKYTKTEILAGALDAAEAEGLSKLTFGRLSKRLGISDRMIVYYFPTKSALITEVLVALGVRIQEALSAAFYAKASDHLALARAAWPVLAQPHFDPTFAVFFEANGLAAAGHAPYQAVVGELVRVWVDWLALLLDGDAERQRAEAEAALVLIDGLLLMRQIGGPEAAERAATALRVRD